MTPEEKQRFYEVFQYNEQKHQKKADADTDNVGLDKDNEIAVKSEEEEPEPEPAIHELEQFKDLINVLQLYGKYF